MRELLPKLAVHFAMGATLGLYAAMILIMGGMDAWSHWLGSGSAPRFAVLSFTGVFALTCGGGAALSGFCFMRDDAEREDY